MTSSVMLLSYLMCLKALFWERGPRHKKGEEPLACGKSMFQDHGERSSSRGTSPHSFSLDTLFTLSLDIPSWPAPPETGHVTGGTPSVLPLAKPASPQRPLPVLPTSHRAEPQRTTNQQTSRRVGRQWSSREGERWATVIYVLRKRGPL